MISRSGIVLMVVVVLAAGSAAAWWMIRGPRGVMVPRTEPSAAPGEATADPHPASAPAIIRPGRFASDAAAPENAPNAGLDPARLYVAGKVVDDRRRAVAGAAVELVTESREPLRSKTASDGRFRIDWGPKPATTLRGTVEAADVNGRAALVSLPDEELRGNVLDVGVLPLSELGILTIRVLEDGAGVAGARVWIGPGHKLGFGPFVTDGQGTLGPKRLPESAYVVTAFSNDLSATGEARVDVIRRGGPPVEVNLAPAWRLRVIVKDGSTGKSVADQAIALTSTVRSAEGGATRFPTPLGRRVAPTNAEGRTVVEGLAPDKPIEVEVLPAGEPFVIQNNTRTKVEPGTGEVVLTLDEGGETFTFPIVADETDGPPDGAEVRLSKRPGTSSAPPPSKGRVVGRNLVVDHLTGRNRSFLARAPDGSLANVAMTSAHVEAKAGPEVRFKKPRALVVTAHDRSGAALSGWLVQSTLAAGPPVPTGPDGGARIDGLYAWPAVEVSLRRPGAPEYAARAVGSVDLTPPGDGRLDVVLDSERTCLLHVTVDGEKRLPPTLHVGVVGARGLATGDVGPIEEDPDEATLRLGLRPEPDAASVKLGISAHGFPFTTVELPLSKDGAPLEGRVALTSGATLRVKVVPPADGLHETRYEIWQSGDSWAIREFPGQLGEAGKPSARHEASGLVAGRYRARDALTGLVSEPVELSPGATAEVTLDLSGAGVVTGRVEGPADAASAASLRPGPAEGRFAVVSVEGTGLVGPGGRTGNVSVPINGEFKVRVPGDRPVTLRVKHAVFSPDPEKGSATVTAPGSTVVLKLVRGAELRFRVRSESRQGRVLFFDGNPDGQPAQSFNFTSDDGVCQVGGFKPGRRTLVFEIAPGAPLVRENVELGEGVTDLGELTFPEGAAIRVKVLVREGQAVPQLTVTASRLGPPEYRRSGVGGGSRDVLVNGLGPGRFRVDVISGPLKAVAASHEVLSTGSGEIPLTVDLR